MTGRAALALLVTLASALALASLAWLLPASTVRGGRHGRATSGLDCAICHTPAGWGVRPELRTAQGFDHDRTGFPLRARHAQAACTSCHEGREPPKRDCGSCHVDDHGGKLGASCDRCHSAASFRSTDALKLHGRTRLPLTGMHALVDCGDCHRRVASQPFSGTPAHCFACHESDYRRPDVHPVHDGSRGAPPFPRDCAQCHRSDAFAPAVIHVDSFVRQRGAALTLAPREHDLRFVISRGAHRGAPCASCHAEPSEPRFVRCASCHDATTLAGQHPRMGAPADGSCTSCHAGGFAR